MTHRFTSRQGIELIKEFELFMPEAYYCPGGVKTIGYGHVVTSQEEFTTISKHEAHELLLKDLWFTERSVLRNIRVELEQYEFDMLCSFTFNVGAASLQRSSLRQKINASHKEEAPREILKWVYAEGRKLTGLCKRREIEAHIFQNGYC